MDVILQFDALNVHQEDGEDRDRLFSLVDGLDENRTLGSYSASQLRTIASAVSAALDNDEDDDHQAARLLSGLSLLGVLVEQSSSAAFAELHPGWIQSLLRVLARRTGDSGVRILAAETFALVLEYAADFPEFARQLSTSVVPQLVQQQLAVECVGDERDVSDVVLMLAVLRHYPGACRTHASAIRRRIMNLLMVASIDRPNLESKAAECLALLPAAIGGVSHGSTKSDAVDDNWVKLYAQLCGSIHLVLDDLYDGYEGERTLSRPAERLPPTCLPDREASDDDDDLTPCRTLRILLLCLGDMLTVDSDASVRSARAIPVEDTMALLCRILNVNLKTLTASRIGRRTLLTSISLPEVHRTCLWILKRLLVVCGRHMSLHGTSVLGIVTKTLQWMDGSGGEANACHPMARLRIAAYKVLVTWLEVVQSPSSLKAVQGPLIANLLSDVAPKLAHSNVFLGASNSGGSRPRSRKKAKRDFESVVDVVHRKVSPWADSDLCLVALDALCAVLCYGADVLKTRSLKEIHETALKVCRIIQTAADFPLPYGEPECRTALYELVAATLVHRTPNFFPDLATCIGIFSRGATLDGHRKIGRCCTRALATCQLLTNPYRLSMFTAEAASDELPNRNKESVVDTEDDRVPGTSITGCSQITTEERSSSQKDNVDAPLEIVINGGDEISSEEVVGEKVHHHSSDIIDHLEDELEEEEEEEEEFGGKSDVVDEPEIVDISEMADEPEIVDFAVSRSAADNAVEEARESRLQSATEDTMQMIASFVDSRPDDA